ncbi:GNAT family N-acetyltransferase [Streptomyces sp. NPDC060194]|uniref:GNAT family N-acetyltransferase n=1 Tax=Streptomyces sp. NPDC060194 TaxID=3347069 RepID=UPI0036634560
MEPITLTTPRLTLRPVGPEDSDAVLAACQDPAIQRWTTVPAPYLREHAEGFTGSYGPDGWRDDSAFTFSVLDTASGALVAMTGVMRRGERSAELGFWTVAEHRGNGFMTEAARAVSRWALESAGIERLEWRAEVGNTASRAVALKAGFTLEGTLRSALVHRDVRRDAWVGSLLPSDLGLPSPAPYLAAPA